MNTDEMIEVMQAYVRGEAIEFCDLDRPDIWLDVTDTPQWAWDLNSYRVKPKPSEKLWYWEFKMSDGWHISQTRMTRAQAQAFVGESVEIAPLYALGFRVKDEK